MFAGFNPWPMTFTRLVLIGFVSASVFAQSDFELPPIDYYDAPSHDPIAALQGRLDRGETQLEFDHERGYLPALLRELRVPVSSQMLVFSQTSFQLRKISPARPRALYFSDEVYFGWVQDGDVVEITAVDPHLGAVFYTLEQEEVQRPKFVRDRGQCIVCHASSRTQGVPGHVVRSVFADRRGLPILGSGTFSTDQNSPFEHRWGGWYVTGTHGAMRHMGNEIVVDRNEGSKLDREAGANVTDLASRCDVTPYLAPTSDIVALMVLEHQSQMHNRITRAHYECRLAQHYDGVMNKALERPDGFVSETTQRRIASAGDALVEYMLFAEEFALTSPVAGVSAFTKEFSELGQQDSRGRSLRDFDLNTRLFKYPCSYLIHSRAFAELPNTMKQYVLGRLRTILRGHETSKTFAHLATADRRAIDEILTATVPEYAGFRNPVVDSE